MKICNTLEETLDGCYSGLHGEVVTEDIYRIKTIDFIPDIIFDFGANVGTFTRHARSLFPKALIIAVEPDFENRFHLEKFTYLDNIVVIPKAIGYGFVYKMPNTLNGAHQMYVTDQVGYPESENKAFDVEEIESVMPSDIFKQYLKPGMKSVMKMDIEGNETAVFAHPESMAMIATLDYFAIETHRRGHTHAGAAMASASTDAAMDVFRQTHDCTEHHVNFYFRKKP